ncbi:MAG: hypothetical protein WDZ26_02440 [Nitriliruptoraceae bacterium]
MVAIVPAVRLAMKFAPVAIGAARRLDRQLRPHVLAYRLAVTVDGVVGRWTTEKKTHWIVFPSPDGAPLRSFPRLDAAELAAANRELDRSALRHHSEMPEAKVRHAGEQALKAPGHVVDRLRRH